MKCDFSEQTSTLPRTKKISTTTPLHKKSLITSGNNASNIGSHLSLAESNVYISTVSIPAYYTEQKQLQRGSLKGIIRKFIGIPFAIIYGIFLYVIMRYMILSSPHDHPVFNTTTSFDLNWNLCSSNFSHVRNRSRKQWMEEETNHFSGDHKEELVYITIFLTVGVGTTSVFSRNTRSTMLLILPGLITSRSRTFLFTFVLGLLCNGPISSIRYNFDAIMENAACMYESALSASCKNNGQLNTVFKSFKGFIEELQKKTEEISKIGSGLITVNLDMKINPNITWPLLEDLIHAPPMSELKAQFSKVLIQVSRILKYTHLTGKILTMVSIILMIIDAVRYIRTYYSDSSFDNMFISRNVQKMWNEKGYKQLTPLRHWELNEGYKVKNSPKCTKGEFYKSIRHGIPTFIFIIVTIMIILTDVLLTAAVRYIKEKDDFTISFSGVQQNYSKRINLELPAYNVSADSCLSHPLYTSSNVYIVISLVLLGAGISCLLEVYMSRIRARMCDVFYPDKALERADYLHYRINIGRINRKCQLMLIVRRELERRAKIIKFSPLARLKHLLARTKKDNEKRTFICPACGWKAKYSKAQRITFKLGKSMVNDKICFDCHIDLLGDEEELGKNFMLPAYGTAGKSPLRKKKFSALGTFSSQTKNTDTL